MILFDLPFLIVSILLVAHGSFIAWVSLHVREGSMGGYWFIVTGCISTSLWYCLTKYSQVRLDYASIFYDLVFGGSTVIFMWIIGNTPTWWQVLGALLAIMGLVIMGIER